MALFHDVAITLGSHPIFGRSGKQDLTIDIPITYPEAALGATISIPTLNGSTKIKVPPGTSSGTTLKLSGKGVETSRSTGDMLVNLTIAVGKDPTEAETEALEALKDAQAARNPRSHLGG